MELTDVVFIHAEKIGLGSDAREAAISAAEGKISAVVADALGRAV
jgi:hypothetical protein